MVPTREDEIVTNATSAIAEARKALNDPEFVKKLRDGEQAVYESRIKDAEDALKAYTSSGSGGPGALGTAMTRPSPVGGNPVGVLGVAVLAVVGYVIAGSLQSVQQNALTKALTLLSTHHREVTVRVPVLAIDEWIQAAGSADSHSTLRLLMAAIFLNAAKLQIIVASIRKDVSNSGGCCAAAVKEFEDAAKQVLVAAMNPTMVPSPERLRRANVLLDKILALYKCLKMEPPLTLNRKVTGESGKCPK